MDWQFRHCIGRAFSCAAGSAVARSLKAVRVVDVQGRKIVGRLESEDPAEEGKFRLVRPHIRRCPPKSVRLSFKLDVRHRDTTLTQCVGNKSGLVRRYDLVVQALKDEQRRVDLMRPVDWRAFAIEGASLRQRAD